MAPSHATADPVLSRTASRMSSPRLGFWSSLGVSIAAVLFSTIFVLHHIGHVRFGNWYWALQPSAIFGLSESETVQGLTPLYRNYGEEYGFDGQFYYRISNDLFIRHDVKLHLDAPSYRYARIFPPAFARLLSVFLFSRYVTPGIYYLAMLMLYAVGVFSLASYLHHHGSPVWYVLPWALFFGVQYALVTGAVDAAGDALLISACVLAFERRRTWIYALCMSATVLTRDTYAVIALGFLILHIASAVKNKKYNALFAYSLPPIAGGSWEVYVRSRLQAFPLSEMLRLVNLPFAAFFVTAKFWATARFASTETRYNLLALLVYLIMVLAAVAIFLSLSVRRAVFAPLFAYTLILCCLGHNVMDSDTNYLRVSSVALGLLALALPCTSGRWRALCVSTLIGTGLASLLLLNRYDLRAQIAPPVIYNSSLSGAPHKQRRLDFSCDLRPVSIAVRPDVTIPIGWAFATPYFAVQIHGRNLSETLFPKNRDSAGKATFLAYHWLQPDGTLIPDLDSLRSSLPRDVLPGEEWTGRVLVLPPKRAGSYLLRISPLDEGETDFSKVGGCHLDVPVQVSARDVSFPRPAS